MDTSVFVYDTFTVTSDRKEVVLHYTTHKGSESFSFSESFVFEQPLPDTLETYRIIRALHLTCGLSYYKLFVNSDIEHPYAMSTREAEFWNTVLTKGLGEFLYVNKISADKLATFGPQEGHDTKTTARTTYERKAMLGIGGGKDSAVAGELLKEISLPVGGFVVATGDATGQSAAVAKQMHVPLAVVKRNLDKTLIDLQARPDAYKGHIPISIIFAFVGSLLAVQQHAQYVVVANESSASIPRAHWEGTDVNHQWSKSLEFEQLLQKYIASFVSPDLKYFSIIRPLTSVGVSKIFSGLPQYFEVFTSDNYVFRVNKFSRPQERWSLESPKSLSSYILLSAWLTQEQLNKIFGHDFYAEQSLEHLFLQLTGLEGEQPLDCVGTPQELRSSINEAYIRGKFMDTFMMGLAESHGIVADGAAIAPSIENFLHVVSDHAIPEELQRIVVTRITEKLA